MVILFKMRAGKEMLVNLRVFGVGEGCFCAHPEPARAVPRKPIDVFIGKGMEVGSFAALTLGIKNDFIVGIKPSIAFAADEDRHLPPFV